MSALPYRVPAPPEPERGPDEEELAYARRLRRLSAQGRLRLAVLVVALVAAMFGLSRKVPRRGALALRPLERTASGANAREAIERARAEARFAQAHFAKEIAASRGDESDCSNDVPTSLARSHRNLPLAILTTEDVAAGNVTSPYLTGLFANVARAEEKLAQGQVVDVAPRAPARDFIVVANKLVPPQATGPASYEPGSIEARVHVYDFATRAILCSTTIHAKSSREVEYAYGRTPDAPAWLGRNAGLQASLDDDFRFEIERAIVHSFARHSSL